MSPTVFADASTDEHICFANEDDALLTKIGTFMFASDATFANTNDVVAAIDPRLLQFGSRLALVKRGRYVTVFCISGDKESAYSPNVDAYVQQRFPTAEETVLLDNPYSLTPGYGWLVPPPVPLASSFLMGTVPDWVDFTIPKNGDSAACYLRYFDLPYGIKIPAKLLVEQSTRNRQFKLYLDTTSDYLGKWSGLPFKEGWTYRELTGGPEALSNAYSTPTTGRERAFSMGMDEGIDVSHLPEMYSDNTSGRAVTPDIVDSPRYPDGEGPLPLFTDDVTYTVPIAPPAPRKAASCHGCVNHVANLAAHYQFGGCNFEEETIVTVSQ